MLALQWGVSVGCCCKGWERLGSGAGALLLLGDVGKDGVDVLAASAPGGLAALVA